MWEMEAQAEGNRRGRGSRVPGGGRLPSGCVAVVRALGLPSCFHLASQLVLLKLRDWPSPAPGSQLGACP